MTQDIIEVANKASKEWLKELPTPQETANLVPSRFLYIFYKLAVAKEREACAKVCEDDIHGFEGAYYLANKIRARGQA